MQSALRKTAKVGPTGTVEVNDPQLPAGETVEVIVLLPAQAATRPSLVDVLAQAPGHLAFKSAEEVDAYIREERGAWQS